MGGLNELMNEGRQCLKPDRQFLHMNFHYFTELNSLYINTLCINIWRQVLPLSVGHAKDNQIFFTGILECTYGLFVYLSVLKSWQPHNVSTECPALHLGLQDSLYDVHYRDNSVQPFCCLS